MGAIPDQCDNRMVDHLKNSGVAVLKYGNCLVI
jgi:hypothetical protein